MTAGTARKRALSDELNRRSGLLSSDTGREALPVEGVFMDRQPPSYWVMVFVVGPAAGVFCWVFWSAWMAVFIHVSFLRILLGGGLMFGLSMGLMFTAMMALLMFNVRREAPSGDLAVIRERLLRIAKKNRLRPAEDAGTYLRLKPAWGLKPPCSHVQAWIRPEETILTGPWAAVPTICKKLKAEAKKASRPSSTAPEFPPK